MSLRTLEGVNLTAGLHEIEKKETNRSALGRKRIEDDTTAALALHAAGSG